MQTNTFRKELPFATVTMTVVEHGQVAQGDYILNFMDEKTALVHSAGVVFKMDPRIAKTGYPFDPEQGTRLLTSALEDLFNEYSNSLPKVDEIGPSFAPHYDMDKIRLAMIAATNRAGGTDMVLPDPLETAAGKFIFVPQPTVDNIQSIDDLGGFNFTMVKTSDGSTVVASMKFEIAEKLRQQADLRYSDSGVNYDRTAVQNLLAQHLYFSFYELHHMLPRDTGNSRSHIGAEKELTVQEKFKNLANSLFDGFLSRHENILRSPDFYMSTQTPQESFQTKTEPKMTMSLHLGNEVFFQILPGDVPPVHMNFDRIMGTVTFCGEVRNFIIGGRGYHYFSTNDNKGSLACLSHEALINAIVSVMARSMAPAGLDDLLDLNSIKFTPAEK